MTALERGMEMMMIPLGDLPDEAIKYGRYLCAQVGMCMETLLSAWTTYAQIVEGLECDDDLYTVTPAIRDMWEAAQK